MIVRKFRLQRGWSQDQLAQISGLSVRTIQRIERGQTPGVEAMKSLAAAFDVNIDDLQQDTAMNTTEKMTSDELKAIEYVRDIKGFYSHAITYLLVVSGLFVLNLLSTPGYIWAFWPAFGWGIGLLVHGTSVFEIFSFFNEEWEQKQIEKRLSKK